MQEREKNHIKPKQFNLNDSILTGFISREETNFREDVLFLFLVLFPYSHFSWGANLRH